MKWAIYISFHEIYGTNVFKVSRTAERTYANFFPQFGVGSVVGDAPRSLDRQALEAAMDVPDSLKRPFFYSGL